MTDDTPSALFLKEADLVRAWQRATTISAFCAATGLSSREASNWAAHHRRYGVPLKHMPRAHYGDRETITRAERRELIALAQREAEVLEADAVRRRCMEESRR